MNGDDLEKMLLDGYKKPTELKKKFSMSYVIEKCQRVGNIGKRVREMHG